MSRGILEALDRACDECDLAANDRDAQARNAAGMQNAQPSIAQLAGMQNALPPELHREAMQTYRNSRYASRIVTKRKF